MVYQHQLVTCGGVCLRVCACVGGEKQDRCMNLKRSFSNEPCSTRSEGYTPPSREKCLEFVESMHHPWRQSRHADIFNSECPQVMTRTDYPRRCVVDELGSLVEAVRARHRGALRVFHDLNQQCADCLPVLFPAYASVSSIENAPSRISLIKRS